MNNMKLKGFIAAAALVASSTAGAVNLPTLTGQGSSLVLTAYDNTTSFLLNDGVTTEIASRGIVVDLGVDMSTFLANPAGSLTSIDVGTLFQDTFFNSLDSDGDVAASNASNIRWNITAGDFGSDAFQNTVLTSSATGLAPTYNNANLQDSLGALNTYFGAVNTASCGAACGFTTPGAANPASNWGQNFAALNANDNTVGLGDALELYQLDITPRNVFGSLSIVGTDAATLGAPIPVAFSLDATGNFTAVSAVPVPAAVWLFGSGLVGLVGVARRRAA